MTIYTRLDYDNNGYTRIYDNDSRLMDVNYVDPMDPLTVWTFDPIDNTTGTWDYDRSRWNIWNYGPEYSDDI